MKKRLLLVDDDRDILKVLKANLEVHGFETTEAENWRQASEILEENLPDLMILDLTLPDGNGIELCPSLKRTYPALPIIMLTARDSVSDKVLGFESGADDYVVKPFETLELIARIKNCLRRLEPAEEMVEINGLSVNLHAHKVTVQGNDIALTPKEFELLKLFIQNKGNVVSRDYIRKSLWRDNKKIYSWSRVIDVHIQHLRQKIEHNPSKPEYIVTVPSAGYRFNA